VLNKLHQTIDDALHLAETGNIVAAEQIAQRILKDRPRDLRALRVMGLAAGLRRQTDKAVALLKRCMSLAPDNGVLHRDMGRILLEAGRFDGALEEYNRAISMMPGDADSLIGKADLLEKAGRFEEVRTLLDPIVEKGDELPAMALILSRIELDAGRHDRALELVRRHTETPGQLPRVVGMLWRTAARCHEQAKDYAEAFAAYEKAKAAMTATFDRASYRLRMESLMSIFTRENLKRVPKGRDRSELPVFVVSMPRAGSTLVEQIIHAHPAAYGAGEIRDLSQLVRTLQETIGSFQQYPECIGDLTQAHVDQLAASYLKEIRTLAPGKKRIVNKDLASFYHLGMIQILFPGARVIHVKRDPMDNGLGIFIANLDASKVPYSTSLSDIGFAIRQHERLMEHWRRELDINMLEVQYEELVADSDTWIRRIIEFCGLPWDDRCLRYYEAKRDVVTLSYDQVRRPIYSSAVARWKRYEQFLAPLSDALREGERETA
jgi:tetratricopeptide (TPR) repeat protein